MHIIKKILFLLFIILFGTSFLKAQTDTISNNDFEWEAFPILNYDSDAGFGYGGKGFVYNLFDLKESFDLTLYNSTKGEHWYRFVFSDIDIQRRQGTKYSAAFDLVIDYDKWINYRYYYSMFVFPTENKVGTYTAYNREVLEVTGTLSKGYAKDFVAEFGFRFKNCIGYYSRPDSEIIYTKNLNSHIQLGSIFLNFRYDTRTNFINPEKGIVLELDNEIACDLINPPDQNFFQSTFLAESFANIFFPHLVFANRLMLQANYSEISYLLKLPLGGISTIRGLPQDRYLCESLILINSELRFPIWKRFGGVAGLDLGNSDSTPDWIIDPVAGLRFFMNNFVVRFDVGFGDETRYYFNFGHMF